MDSQVLHRSECKEKRDGLEFHEAFLHLNGNLGGVQDPVISHAAFNYPTKRGQFQNTAHLNTLSSISGVIRGEVSRTLGEQELRHYATMDMSTLSGKGVVTFRAGELMISRLVQEILPKDIEYLRIIVAERAKPVLEKYYMRVGDILKDNGVIRETSYYGGHAYIDGVSYCIR